MRIQQFLEHHGIASNPFADEDAQTDLVFKGFCIKNTYHPSWDKIYGDPSEPSTAVVFGEKGSGKTALGLQIVRHLADYNRAHRGHEVFVIPYDDFNPFLDRFREHFSGRKRRPERLLTMWRLWDHVDAVLSLGVTQLVDRLLENKQARHPAVQETGPLPVASLQRDQLRDILLLAACYDHSTAESFEQRWKRLRRKLRYHTWSVSWDLLCGLIVTLAVLGVTAGLGQWTWFKQAWPYLFIAAGWLPRLGRCLRWSWQALRIRRHLRVLDRPLCMLRRVLMRLPGRQLAGQPLPNMQRTDDRYELLGKFQGVLRSLGFPGIVVLVDRIDEPYLINGSAELMRALLWPMLDNKFLKHPGLGLKLLLPSDLARFIDREDRDFYERARLDKQNMVRSLDWTGQALFDLADDRLKACAGEAQSPNIAGLFDESMPAARLQAAFASLRVPRHLFKFMYRLLAAHCNAHSEQQPVWGIGAATFESTLAVYLRELDASDRGVGAI